MTDKPFSKIQPRAGFTPCAGLFSACAALPNVGVRKTKRSPHENPIMIKVRCQPGMRKGKQGCRI